MCYDAEMLRELGMENQTQYTMEESQLTGHGKLVSIMEHGLQLRQEIHSIREQFKGILDNRPAHSNSTPRTPGCSTPRTPLQPLDRKLLTPQATPRCRGPRMGYGGASAKSTAAPNALVALQNYLKNRTPSKRKLSMESEENSPASASKMSRLNASGDDKENITTKSDTPSTRSRKSLKRISTGSRDSLKKLLLSPKRRNMLKTVKRSPILTNGILIRNKEGELLNPPEASKVQAKNIVRKRLLVDTELPQSPCVLRSLGQRSCGDGQERICDIEVKPKVDNRTIELSSANYTKSPDTFYVIDKLKDRTTATDIDVCSSPMFSASKHRMSNNVNGYIQNAVKNMISDKTCMSDQTVGHKTAGDKTLGDLSMISQVAEGTMREQPSAIVNVSGGDVLHSTLNYPLHSTMFLDNLGLIREQDSSIHEDDTDCDSSVMSFCVDEASFRKPTPLRSVAATTTGDCDVCKVLKRQTGQGRLQHPRRALGLSESDFLFDRTVFDDSLDATRGTIADPSDITCCHGDRTVVASPSMGSSLDQTTIRDITLCHRPNKSHSRRSRKSHNHSDKSSKSASSSRSQQQQFNDFDSDKENNSAAANRQKRRSSHISNSSDNTSSFSSTLNPEKKRELKRKLKRFNSSVQDKSVDIKTLGFF